MSDDYLKSDLAYALENGEDEVIESLEKGELAFYITDVLGLDPEDVDLPAHPSEFSGTVGRNTLRAWAKAANQ